MEKIVPKKVKFDDYEILNTLGTGSFGRVKLARHKLTNKYFALKMLKKSDIVKSKQVDHVMNENQILSMINHPFIVNMEGFCQDAKYLYFVLEFVSGGELFTYLRGVGSLANDHAAYLSPLTQRIRRAGQPRLRVPPQQEHCIPRPQTRKPPHQRGWIPQAH